MSHRKLLVLGLTVWVASAAPTTAQTFAQFRLGAFFPTAESAFWEDNVLDGEDFIGVAGGATLLHGLNDQLAVGLNFDVSEKTVTISQRHSSAFPVFSDTTLVRVPMMIDLRFVPGGFYDAAGSGPVRHLRRKPAFYIGGGIGALYWEYEELGEFVGGIDDRTVFFDRLADDGVALAAHACRTQGDDRKRP